MPTSNPLFWDFRLMREANRREGFHFWDPDTREFFDHMDGRVFQGPGGVFFSYSIKGLPAGRWFRVARFDPDSGRVFVQTPPEVQGRPALTFESFEAAHLRAHELARKAVPA